MSLSEIDYSVRMDIRTDIDKPLFTLQSMEFVYFNYNLYFNCFFNLI